MTEIVSLFGKSKRPLPSWRLLEKNHADRFNNPFGSLIPKDSIYRRHGRLWPQEKRELLAFYGISHHTFTKIIYNKCHVSLYEMICIADVLDLELSINLTPKQ